MFATPQSAVPGNLARLFHWIMAAMILGLFALGSALEEFPRGSARDFGMMLRDSSPSRNTGLRFALRAKDR
ncbi:MAG: hypothetical protein O9320_13980 [Magnetospirillum sp.]|nr:hypothetical protein [Magnetospirillum sp.]